MATHAATGPRPRCHGDAGSEWCPSLPGTAPRLRCTCWGRGNFKPGSASVAAALSRRSFAYSQPRFRECARTPDFNHLLLGDPLPRERAEGPPAQKPAYLSQHPTSAGSPVGSPTPRRARVGRRSLGNRRGTAPAGAAARTPASASFARQRGDLRLLGRVTRTGPGYFPAEFRRLRRAVQTPRFRSDQHTGFLCRGEHASGTPGCAIVRRPCGRGGGWGRPEAVEGQTEVEFLCRAFLLCFLPALAVAYS